ncbi:FMN-binding negative transcriptional regulator [Sphingomonas gei]|uniref:FMN-binding negative transcriptional regulator n=1 Tax=Sphingomonas gei TaxID=1395960 RepID=A0A4S1XIW8_9SPHN|nr:FMN-binding negative transcriptional regulator [Sphingomonas gei]TGX55763.1 FMN-binding negative transcriptional regulator [Sphingomonas gei]
MKFDPGTDADLLKLIAEHPLAWLVSRGAGRFEATPLPMLAETDAEGALVSLLGHCSRFNAQVADLRADPSALLLFTGPQAYMSPEPVRQPRWVPTWNFAVAVIAVEVEFVEEETLAAIDSLTNAMETGRARPWTLADAGERVAALLPRIIAFRAHVRGIDARFKLGQEESAATVSDLLSALPEGGLADWMRRMNADRLASLETAK